MLEIQQLTKHYGGRTVLDAVELRVDPRARIGLIGRNGEGKSTLLRIIAGLEPADDGRVARGRTTRVGYLRQEVDPSSERSVLEEARTAQAPLRELERRITALEAEIEAAGEAGNAVPAELAARYENAQTEFERLGGFAAEAELRGTLAGLGLGASWWERPLRELSGGWLMRVELAKLLLARPEVLLLDEPTNHLDLESIAWFEGRLQSYPGAVIVVSHDRAFLNRHALQIAELLNGRLTVYRGNYSGYIEQRDRAAGEIAARREHLERQIAHAAKFIERFGAKNTKATQAESRKKMIARLEAELETLHVESARPNMRFRFPPAPRSGEIALRLEQVHMSYGARKVYAGVDLEVRRGERIALIGPNGSGKSTLLRLIAGQLEPEAGVRELGHNVRLAYYAQHQREALDDRRTVLEEIGAEAPLDMIPQLRSLLGAFLFRGDDVEKRVSVLSGGERARLALAKLLLRGANLLVLDEPTNHLDIPAIDILTEALRKFEGTLVIISHDRDFIDQLANVILEVRPGETSARLERHPGNYGAYLHRLQAAASAAAAMPAAAPGPVETRPSAAAPSSGTRTLSKNAVRRLREEAEDTERTILDTETEIEQIDQLLAHPSVARDGDRMRSLAQERADLDERLRELYAHWQHLEDEIAAAAR
jgi:ATP-binding cassette, subfamily F, member 3